jgi:phospholipid/cholesterol/gamma-HCH transport system permease protein
VIETASSPNLVLEQISPGVLRVRLWGDWRAPGGLPGVEIIKRALSENTAGRSLEFDVSNLTNWDSRLVAFVGRCAGLCREGNIDFRGDKLPDGVRRLLRLAAAVPEKRDAHISLPERGFLQDVGEGAFKYWNGALRQLGFLGDNVLALGNLLRGRALLEILFIQSQQFFCP